MLSFRMFALSLDGFPSPISPAPSAPFGISSSFTSFTSLTSSTSRSPVHAQQTPHLLSSDRNPAPTRHTRHAGAPATPSFSYASALFPSHRGCAPRDSTENPLLFPSAFLTPLNATLTNPRATVASKRLPGTLNPADATLTKTPDGSPTGSRRGISRKTRPFDGTISRRLGPFRSGAGSWDYKTIQAQRRGLWRGRQTRCGCAGHDALEGFLEALHFRLRADGDAHVRGPDGPGTPNKNILCGHRGDNFLRRALGVQHEAVGLRWHERIAVLGEPLKRRFADCRVDLFALRDEPRIFQAGHRRCHGGDGHGVPAGECAYF